MTRSPVTALISATMSMAAPALTRLISAAGPTAAIAFNVNLATQNYQFLPNAFGANGTYDAQSIENVIGSDFNDTITGDGVANVLKGGGGADTILGGGGVDNLFGDAGETF